MKVITRKVEHFPAGALEANFNHAPPEEFREPRNRVSPDVVDDHRIRITTMETRYCHQKVVARLRTYKHTLGNEYLYGFFMIWYKDCLSTRY